VLCAVGATVVGKEARCSALAGRPLQAAALSRVRALRRPPRPQAVCRATSARCAGRPPSRVRALRRPPRLGFRVRRRPPRRARIRGGRRGMGHRRPPRKLGFGDSQPVASGPGLEEVNGESAGSEARTRERTRRQPSRAASARAGHRAEPLPCVAQAVASAGRVRTRRSAAPVGCRAKPRPRVQERRAELGFGEGGEEWGIGVRGIAQIERKTTETNLGPHVSRRQVMETAWEGMNEERREACVWLRSSEN
jgi:hypothetical protein